MKKAITLTCIFFISVFFLTACFLRQHVSYERISRNQEKANELLPIITYKQDAKASFGRNAAVFQGDLYYFADRNEESGIYKRETGSQADEKIIDAKGIRKIQVVEEGIYYLGRTEENDTYNESANEYKLNTYQLFYHQGHEKNSVEDKLLSEELFAWDFYVKDEAIFFFTIDFLIPNGQARIQKYLIDISGTTNSWKVSELNSILLDKDSEKQYLFEYMNIYICVDEDMDLLASPIGVVALLSLYNKEIHQTVCFNNSQIVSEGGNGRESFFITEYDDQYICGKEGYLYLEKDEQIRKQTSIEGVTRFSYFIRSGEFIYLVGETKKGERIYRLELETFEVEELQELGKRELVLAMSEDTYITINKKEVQVKDIQTGEILEEKKWDKKVDLEEDRFEIAGNCVFAYENDTELSLKNEIELSEFK